MHAPIDLSITPQEQITIHVAGWPSDARSALCERVKAELPIADAAPADDRIVLTFPRGGTNVSAVKRFVLKVADELLPEHGLSYRH